MSEKVMTQTFSMETGEPDPLHQSITAALQGDFQLVKPCACQPPNNCHFSIGTNNSRSKRSNKSVTPPNSQPSPREHSTENQLDSMILSSVTPESLSEEFDTAHSQSEELSFYENDRSNLEHHEFLLAEKLVDRDDIPDDLKEELIFCHHPDKYTRLLSNINWQAGKSDNKLDCAAQITTKNMVPCANGELHSNSNSSKENTNSLVVTVLSIDQSISEPTQPTVAEVKKRPANCRESVSDNNIKLSTSLSELRTHSSAAGLVYYIDNMITDQKHRKTNLHKPLKQLSPKRKKEVNNFLKETAESLDLTTMSFDTSKSSYELLHSIIREARKRYGDSKNHWSRKFPDSIDRLAFDKLNLSKSETKFKERNSNPRKAKSDVLVFKSPNKPKNKKLNQIPSLKNLNRKNSRLKTPKKENRRTPVKKKASKICQQYEKCHEPCKVHFECNDPSVCISENTENNVVSICSDGILSDRSSQAFLSCEDNLVHAIEGGVCTCHKLEPRTRSHKLVPLPKVEMFSKSTKSGFNQFYEILKAKLSIPSDSEKYELVGPTVPVPLQSEAHWHNGELNLIVKEIDRDLAMLPKPVRDQITKVPHFINIDFVREFKEKKTSPLQNQQLSPSLVRTLCTRSPLVSKEKKPIHSQLIERPFNTKVDYITKKEPLVVGTLAQEDKKKAQSRTIKSKKISSKSTPMYCFL